MSLTYPPAPNDHVGDHIELPRFGPAHEEPFVPVYARRGKARSGKGRIRTWMILVPVGVLTLGGIGAMMAMNEGEQASAPLAEPAATLPVLATPSIAPASEVAPLDSASTPAPVITEPTVRQAATTPRAAPTTQRPAAAPAAPAAAPVAQTPDPIVAAGPQPYTPPPAAPSTSASVPAAPAPTTASPPVIIIDPAG